MNLPDRFRAQLDALPLLAILRGLRPEDAVAVGTILVEEGIRLLEVPMNSPDPLESVRRMRRALGDEALVGVGTLIDRDRLEEVIAAGAQVVVTPHFDPSLVAATRAKGLVSLPGVLSPTEAFAALAAGAHALKLFPAEACPPPMVHAIRAVLPPETILLPVGGIREESMAPYFSAGASGFGLGGRLFKPGMDLETIRSRARSLVASALLARKARP